MGRPVARRAEPPTTIPALDDDTLYLGAVVAEASDVSWDYWLNKRPGRCRGWWRHA